MEEAPENGKESPHSVHANGLIDSTHRVVNKNKMMVKFMWIYPR